MEHIETEYKWAVNKRSDFKKLKNILAAQGWDCAFYAPVLLDSYFDAPGGALSAEKSALRLRKTVLDGKTFYELTLKINRALSVYVDGIDTEIENYKTLPHSEIFSVPRGGAAVDSDGKGRSRFKQSRSYSLRPYA